MNKLIVLLRHIKIYADTVITNEYVAFALVLLVIAIVVVIIEYPILAMILQLTK
ncbi:hypothetical protein HY947_01190 [Candidatus Gottesmanbacteria bacterium]|nr:hypothetical protein [Candidatus Gottesmanbacteria bacterium]